MKGLNSLWLHLTFKLAVIFQFYSQKNSLNTEAVSRSIPIPKPSRSRFQNQYQYWYPRGDPFNTNIETLPKVSKIFNSKPKWTLWKSIGNAQVWLSIGKSCYKQIGLAQIGPMHLSLPSHIIRPWQPWQEQLKINNIKKSCECPTIELT